MGKKIMLINATDTEEIRVAVLNDGVLSDFDIEFIHNEKIKGNIYKARVTRVDMSLQAAFVHYGGQKNGFLPIGELPKDLVSPDGRRGRIQDLLHRDQEIMVQVVREELGTKGAMVTAQISLPGRYLVLTPGSTVNGISRKIEGREEREFFKQLVDSLIVPPGMGVIVRTASLGVTREDFERDMENLLDTYREVQSLYKKREGAGLVWQEDDVVTRTLRDTWVPDIEEIHIDDADTLKSAQSFFRRVMPQYLKVLHLYNGKKPLFSKFQTEEQIERIYGRRVPLPGGGAVVLDQTEALVAIDVNSGKTAGDNQEDTAFRTNLEAAETIAAQLRLRDLAGLIVIDFIDMKRETNNKAVMERLVECLRHDKARMEVGRINRFGVLVMTRQRIRPSIQHVTHEACPVCQGTGQVKNSEALVLSVLRRLKSVLSKNGVTRMQLKLAPSIAMNLLNQRRSDLAELEVVYGAAIVVVPDHDITYGEISMEITRRDEVQEHAKRHEMPKREAEDETVILAGDGPISFDRALPQPDHHGRANHPDYSVHPEHAIQNGQNGRRVAQRAALDERERLRALFEAPKTTVEGKPDKSRPDKKNQAKESFSRPQPEVTAPPKLTPEIVASLTVPPARTRKLSTPAAESGVPPLVPDVSAETKSAGKNTRKEPRRNESKTAGQDRQDKQHSQDKQNKQFKQNKQRSQHNQDKHSESDKPVVVAPVKTATKTRTTASTKSVKTSTEASAASKATGVGTEAKTRAVSATKTKSVEAKSPGKSRTKK